MNPFISPSEFNGKILSLEQCMHLYFDIFVDEDGKDLDSNNIKFFLRSQNINDFFSKKEDHYHVYYVPFWEGVSKYKKKDSKKIYIILNCHSFLRSLITIYENIKIYKIPFSFKGSLNNIETYSVDGEKRIYFINEEFSLFFKEKGFLEEEELYFSANIYSIMMKSYELMKQPIYIPSLMQALDRFKFFLHKKYKENTWTLKRKQLEDELEKFFHEYQGFKFTKEQKIALVQFSLILIIQTEDEE